MRKALSSPDAVLGRDVSIGPFSSVGRGARIGDRTVIHPNVCIGEARSSATIASSILTLPCASGSSSAIASSFRTVR